MSNKLSSKIKVFEKRKLIGPHRAPYLIPPFWTFPHMFRAGIKVNFTICIIRKRLSHVSSTVH